jgi:hypothetical protein
MYCIVTHFYSGQEMITLRNRVDYVCMHVMIIRKEKQAEFICTSISLTKNG